MLSWPQSSLASGSSSNFCSGLHLLAPRLRLLLGLHSRVLLRPWDHVWRRLPAFGVCFQIGHGRVSVIVNGSMDPVSLCFSKRSCHWHHLRLLAAPLYVTDLALQETKHPRPILPSSLPSTLGLPLT
ncbi:hypothetical protein M408DRAFT_169979 [Serendipita vermifera MAFF 305830]|uniref:Uncharacterized protein n=1 Tax=Serendipita vermifera MAFF 305830 TaxID=933852 RepID=A0A0C3AS95_SERVB|nr:hypothetical protein M408DRAFT_169979 [Serendipita vermifera MAFF 305830]